MSGGANVATPHKESAMADDFSADINTTGRISVNAVSFQTGVQYVTGNLEAANGHDWFRVWLWAGETYVVREIDRNNAPYSGLTLPDAFLALHNSTGAEIIRGVGNRPQATAPILYSTSRRDGYC